MEEKDNLLKLASAIYAVFGDGDKQLGINRVIFDKESEKIIIFSPRVGLIIGRQGRSLDELRKQVEARFGYPTEIELKDFEPIPILSQYANYW